MHRRSILRAVGTALVGGASATAGCSLAFGADSSAPWPTLQYDNRRTGHAPTQTGPSPPVERKWTFQLPGLDGPSSPPAVPNSAVVVGRDAVFVADMYRVFAVERATGTKRWDAWLDAPTDGSCFEGPLLLAEGLVFLDSCSGLYAFDQQSGDVHWRRRDGPAYGQLAHIDGALYAADEAGISKFDVETGDRRSRSAFDTGEGEIRTRRKFTITRDAVYARLWDGSDGTLAAYDVDTGEERWRFDPDGVVAGYPTVVDETVFVGGQTPGDKGTAHFYAVDEDSGHERWRFESEPGNSLADPPAVADGLVYIDGEGPTLRALDVDDGSVEWTFDTSSTGTNAPSVASDSIYFRADDALIVADPQTGEERWRDGSVSGLAPAVVDRTVYALTTESVVAIGEV